MGKHAGPIQSRLWIKDHELLGKCMGALVVCKPLYDCL